jgi:amino acid adenylation domain-containing protein
MTTVAEISPLVATVLSSGPAGSEQPAICTRDRSVSYGELRRDVLALSDWLRTSGCAPGDRIALYLPKTLETIEIILGILAAGAAYVPINPALPPEAVKQILTDVAPFMFITNAKARAELLQAGIAAGAKVATVGTGANFGLELVGRDEHRPSRKALAGFDDLAVILYTSGSTGVPKGIALSHRNVMSFVDWAARTFAVTSADQVTSHAPLHFDLSTFDIFCTLSRHGTLHLVDELTAKFPGAVRGLIEQRKISIWYSVPTALMQLQERDALKGLTSLRLILFAGEVFPMAALRRVMTALPAPEYANLYGPTETNVCTYYRLPGLPASDSEALPIGRPCEHLEVFLRDDDGNAVADGAQGEICVAGPGVMKGYWNRPELTAAVRVVGRADSYRTGDYGYRRVDGMLMYAGRRDQQVKVRGHRIELLALEAALNSHQEVKESAAVVAADPQGVTRLQTFLVPRQAGTEPAGIAKFLAERLPPYYQPDRVEWLDEMPRTSSGKCDRATLLSRARANFQQER